MKANTKYNKSIADKFHDTKYYESNEYDIRNKDKLTKEKRRLSTKKSKIVSDIIKEKRCGKEEKVFNILKNIYEKNKNVAFGLKKDIEPKNSDLMNIVSDTSLLMISYAKVRKNPGSTTIASPQSSEEFNKLNEDQKRLIKINEKGSDGINLDTFKETSRLLKLGKYPWGTSKRIYIEKPGKPGSKRPITIPPFMDRVVQEAIRNILVSIYEPFFDKMNVSFGFRPGLSVQDAIHALTNRRAEGLNIALEGDIKSAYDKVNRKKLIEILEKKIKDKKFIKLIEDRLNYEYFDTEKEAYIKEKEGIPQGGTDSPYLWNIYMLEFDIFIEEEIKKYINEINIKNRGPNSDEKRILCAEKENLKNHKLAIKKVLNWIRKTRRTEKTFKEKLIELSKTDIKKWKDIDPIFTGQLKNIKSILKDCKITIYSERDIIISLQKRQKKIIHKMMNLPFLDPNKKRFRYLYARYADDWIIISNIKEQILMEIKRKISNFLSEILYAQLSDEKTLITKIEINPAHFLGFEIRTYQNMKIGKYEQKIKNTNIESRKTKSKQTLSKTIIARTAGNRVFAGVDNQRLIDRLHMKGYCNTRGFPREITKLSNLETFTIIDRTNSILTGVFNHYVNYIRNPRSQLNRWEYIIRYSCFKTLALKYKTTIREILKKFKPEEPQTKPTIEDKIIISLGGIKFSKTWKLETLDTLMIKCRGKNAQIRKKEITDRYWQLHRGEPIEYSEKKKSNILNSGNFLDRINWVNIRTRTSFELPCCICGYMGQTEMHHVKHVRKVKYNTIKKERTWEQVMGLRNRRQIPVCRDCHINIIHKGKYRGQNLRNLSLDKLYDNRIINIESYVHTGDPDKDYSKSMEEKGWTIIKEK